MTRSCFTRNSGEPLPSRAPGHSPKIAHGPRCASRTLALALAILLPLAQGAGPTEAAPSRRAFDVDAPIAILLEAESGTVLFEKQADLPHPPASIVKIMTMLLLMEAIESGDIGLSDVVTVSARASKIGGSQAYLAEGEEMTVHDLLKAVAIHSANDACVALAEYIDGDVDAFVDRMNDKAAELGMDNTVFVTPHGLPPEAGQEPDVTSARDVARMARELILKHPTILKYTGRKHDSLRGGKFHLDNTNRL
ncbi:MAG: D-alanyl-D-alanine carboxypeptidase family protein, partial [Myxococcota bacterium]